MKNSEVGTHSEAQGGHIAESARESARCSAARPRYRMAPAPSRTRGPRAQARPAYPGPARAPTGLSPARAPTGLSSAHARSHPAGRGPVCYACRTANSPQHARLHQSVCYIHTISNCMQIDLEFVC